MLDSQELEKKQFFQPVLKSITTVLKVPASIWLVDETGGILRFEAASEKLEKELHNASFRLDEPSVTYDVFKTEKLIFVADIESEERWRFKPETIRLRLKSAVLAPLWTKKKIVGVLYIYIPENMNFVLAERKPIIESFSNQIASTHRQIRSLEILNEVSRLISLEIQRPNQLFRQILQSTQKVLDCEHVSIFLLDENSGDLELAATSSDRLVRKRFKAGEGLAGKIAQTGQTRLVLDVRDDPNFVRGYTSPDLKERSMLLAPIKLGAKIAGVISADMDRLDGFDTYDQRLIEALANQASVAIHNERLFHQSEMLQKVAQIVNSTLNREEVIGLVLDQLRNVIEYDSASIQLIEGDRRILVGARGFSLKDASPYLFRNVSEDPLVSKIVQEQQPVVLSDVNKEDGLWQHLPQTAHVNSWIGVPLIAKGRVIGLLTLDHLKPSYYTQESGEIAAAFANQVATALPNTNLFQQVRDQAQALTELNELSRRLVSFEEFTDRRNLLEKVAESAKEVLKADLIELYEYRSDQNKYELPQISVGEVLEPRIRKKIYEPEDAVWMLIHNPGPLYVENTQAPSSIFTVSWTIKHEELPKERFVVREKILSAAAIPLRAGNESMGLMFANYRTLQTFTSEQRELIELFANQAAIAIKNARLFQLKRDQAKALNELNQLAQRLVSIKDILDTRNLLERIAESAKEVLKAELIELYEYRADQNKYELPQISVGEVLEPRIRRKIYEPEDAVWMLIHEPGPLYVENTQAPGSIFTATWKIKHEELPKERFVVREKILSTAAIPLRTGNESMGLMFANYRTPQAFTAEQRELIELFAKQAAIAIKNIRLYYYVNKRRKALVEIGQELTAGIRLNENDVLELIYKEASQSLGMENLSIALYDETTDTVRFELAAVNGRRVDVENEPGWKPRQGGNGKTERIIRSKKYLLLPTQQEVKKTGFSPIPEHKDYEGALPNSWLGVPMIVGEKVLGVIANYHYGQDNFYNDDDIEILQALADQAAIAIDNAKLYYRLNQRQKALVKVGQELTAGIRLHENEVLELVYEQASQSLGMENLSIALYDETTDTVRFELAAVNDRRVDVENEPGWKPRQGGNGKTERIIRCKKYLLLPTQEEVKKTGFSPIPGHKDYEGTLPNSWLGVPMIVGEKVLGVIANTHYGHDYFYNDEDIEILQALADQAAIAIDNARLYYGVNQRLARLNQRLTLLVEIGKKLTSSARLLENEILELVYKEASGVIDTSNMFIALYNELTDALEFKLVVKDGERDIQTEKRWQHRKAERSKSEWIVRERQPILCRTRKELELYDEPGLKKPADVRPWCSWVGVPMVIENKVLGVIAVGHPTKEYVYDDDDLQVLLSIASQAAIAIHNSRLYEDAKQLRDEKIAAEQLATLGTAIAALQHRINNTFSIIFPNLARLKNRVDIKDETIAEILNIIERNARFTSALISRIYEPLGEIEDQNVDINAVLEEVVNKLKDQQHMESVEIKMELDDSIPRIRAPIGQIVEVFRNLFDNAFRAMPQGGSLSIVSYKTMNKICVRVQDTGSGIAPDVQERLFVKPVPSKDLDRKSTGLGLWLSQLMLKRIGGSIKIEKSDAVGTTMLVQISLSSFVEKV